MIRKFLSALALAFAVSMPAEAYQVKASVVDAEGQALPYVTYRIYADTTQTAVTSAVADADGVIAADVTSAGDYRLAVVYVGMADAERTFAVSNAVPVADLGVITMTEQTNVLDDVTVTAQRPLVTKLIDRVAYDVQADPERPTLMIRDILRKVPMVSVDADGTIRVNGSTSFKIYKNGRPNNSLSRNAKDLFAAMPASTIKRIEVITEPGAEFDAEGTTAILNIITEDNTAIKGVLGSVYTSYETHEFAPSGGMWLTSEIGKVNFNVYGGYQRIGGANNRYANVSDYTYKQTGDRQRDESTSDQEGHVGYFGLEGSYQLDTLNLFTAEMSGFAYGIKGRSNSLNATYNSLGDLLGSYRTKGYTPHNGYFDMNANFNWQHRTHRPDETYTLSYLVSTTHQSSESENAYSDMFGTMASLPYTGMNSDYTLNFIEHTVQGDYTRTLGGIHILNFGLKGIMRRNHSNNETEYVGYRDDDREFKHITSIGAAYAQYSVRLGAVSLRGGLRYEYSHLSASYPDGKGDNYSSDLNDVVPSASVKWQVNDANSLAFAYSSSISRPGISYLNPAVTETPTTLSYGNPDLNSARSQSMKLSYSIIKNKFNIDYSMTYRFINNGISSITSADENNIITNTYGNVGHFRNFGNRIYVQWTVTPKTTFSGQFAVNYNRYKMEGYTLGRWTWDTYGNIRQSLPFKFDLSLNWWCSSGYVNSVYGYDSNSFANAVWYGVSLSRSFLKEDRLNVRVTADRPFARHTAYYDTYTVNGDYTGMSRMINSQPFAVRFSLSYRFGSLQASVRKTDTSIENDDLIGRKQ